MTGVGPRSVENAPTDRVSLTRATPTIDVSVHLIETSQPITHHAVNTYTKGALFCVYDGERVYKYPLANVWRIVEQYAPMTEGTR